MNMRSQCLMRPFLAACLLYAVALGIETRDNLYLGGKDGTADPKLGLRERINWRRSGAVNASCTNQPSSRQCWDASFDIETDVDKTWPVTGRTAYYTLTIRNTTCNPDGRGSRPCLLINDQYPGPTLQAEWGDTFQIQVVNRMQDNGTSIHWHGLRQWHTNSMDGTNGVTECPLAPGQSKLYMFQATQHGTFWYHSHHSAQYGDGIFGAIVINGPATANYDVDLGSVTLNEWYYDTDWQISSLVNSRLQLLPTGNLPASGPPSADNILINGTNKSPQGDGDYLVTRIELGKSYRLRLVNSGADNALRVSLDGHPFQVITADFVPVRPFTADSLLLNVGQRYDVIITANQTVGNYWFRANAETACKSFNNGAGLSIFRYISADAADPVTSSSQLSSCDDAGPLVPWWPTTVPQDEFYSQVQALDVNVELPGLATNNQNLVVWGINLTAIDVDWEMPVLSYVYSGNKSYPFVENVISIPKTETWVYWIVQETAASAVPIPHPIHLHGHNFFILGTGSGVWSASSSLNFENPPRRESATLPSGGWLFIAFRANNPGAWLMHCHIAWHISEGLGVVFLEATDKIAPATAQYDQTCQQWKSYQQHAAYAKTDSGL